MKTDKKEILKELLLSENRGNVVSIKVRDTHRPVRTAVQQAAHNKIILQPSCICGHPVLRTEITLLDIEWIRGYKVLYGSPALDRIRNLRPALS